MNTYQEIMDNFSNLPSDAFKLINSAPTMTLSKMKALAKHFLAPRVYPNRSPYETFAKRMPVTSILEILSYTVENDPEHKGLLPYYAKPSLLQYSKNDAERAAVETFMSQLR